MSVRPILFSAPMVRALMAGTKSQTRRIIKPQPRVFTPHVIDITEPTRDDETGQWGQTETVWSTPSMDCPMGEPMSEVWRPLRLGYGVGDRLWVRETWAPLIALKHNDPGCLALVNNGFYRADKSCHDDEIAKWSPSIFMPRHASRLTLKVSDVRIERLKDISKLDVIAEGISERDGLPIADCVSGWHEPYAELWDALNGAGAWDKNPWVVALTFDVHKGNIDALNLTERVAA